MFQRFRDISDDAITQDIRGTTVYGINDDKLGTIDDIVFDPESNDSGYAVIDSGGWLNSRKFMVPVDRLEDYNESQSEFRLRTSREQLQALPQYDDSLLDDESRFRAYREQWRTAWENPTRREERHPRLAAIEDRYRARAKQTMAREPVAVVSPAPAVVNRSESARNVAVYGVFHDRDKVREAVDALHGEGFADDDISVVFPEKEESERFAVENNTKAPEGATAGGVTGVVAGGVLGWLAGVGAIAIPGIGPLLAAGPIVAALAGAGAAGAAGGLVGGLIGLGVPEYEAKRFHDEVKAGRILIAVHCSDVRFTHSARAILDRLGAKEVFTSGQERAA